MLLETRQRIFCPHGKDEAEPASRCENETGAVIDGSTFMTNVDAHTRVLSTQMLIDHGLSTATGRHVGWVVNMLRSS